MVSQLGFSVVTPILLCTYIGYRIDQVFHGYWTVILLLLGVLAGLLSGYRLVQSVILQNERDEQEEKEEQRKKSEKDKKEVVMPKVESRILRKKDE